MTSSFFSTPTDYTVVEETGEGPGFYDGPAYSEIDPVAINDSVAEAAASAASAVSSAASSASSAAAALVSQNAAAASATAADASEATAAASEAEATAQAAIATTQAGNAATSAAAASTSASAALVSEGNADTSETNAAASATAALASQNAAATSETNAATSASNAATAVQDAAGTATPIVDGAADVGTGVKWAREDHVHPTDTSRAPLASPALTGTPTAPTAAVGTDTTQLATTAFVKAAFGASLSASGYQKLPSGLIIQWGLYAGGGDTTLSFPIAFPTALLGVVATPQYAASASTLVAATVANGSTTGFDVFVRFANGSSSGTAGEAVRWMAWGY